MHYLPSFWKFAEDEREQTVRRFPIRQRQMKIASDECRIPPQHFDLQVPKLQLAHFVSRALIIVLVAIECRLPAFEFVGG